MRPGSARPLYPYCPLALRSLPRPFPRASGVDEKQKAAGVSPRPGIDRRRGRSACPQPLSSSSQSAWADLGEVKEREECVPACRGAHSVSRSLLGRVATVKHFLALVAARLVEPADQTIPVIVERQAQRPDQPPETDRGDVLL